MECDFTKPVKAIRASKIVNGPVNQSINTLNYSYKDLNPRLVTKIIFSALVRSQLTILGLAWRRDFQNSIKRKLPIIVYKALYYFFYPYIMPNFLN